MLILMHQTFNHQHVNVKYFLTQVCSSTLLNKTFFHRSIYNIASTLHLEAFRFYSKTIIVNIIVKSHKPSLSPLIISICQVLRVVSVLPNLTIWNKKIKRTTVATRKVWLSDCEENRKRGLGFCSILKTPPLYHHQGVLMAYSNLPGYEKRKTIAEQWAIFIDSPKLLKKGRVWNLKSHQMKGRGAP